MITPVITPLYSLRRRLNKLVLEVKPLPPYYLEGAPVEYVFSAIKVKLWRWSSTQAIDFNKLSRAEVLKHVSEKIKTWENVWNWSFESVEKE